MLLSHKIRLNPTPAQRDYFARAAGTHRFTWNWALAEWNRRYEAGEKPSGMDLRKQFNGLKYAEFPWLKDMHRDSHAQSFADLQKAWGKTFADFKAGKGFNKPRFKKKGVSKDSFYVANDQFKVNGTQVRLPRLGVVQMAEALRFDGKIMGARVSRTADHWYIAIQVELKDGTLGRKADGVVGVDLGVSTLATLSTGEKVKSPKALAKSLRRLKIRQRRHSRKTKGSSNRVKSAQRLARLHARIASVRKDFTHKLTTKLCRENQTVVIEDLNVKGMLSNGKLARHIADVGFGEFRRQLEYKSLRYGTRLVVADRWFPSSKLCSACGSKNESLKLSDRVWVCKACGVKHDRDGNAALNLKRLATETALPVANADEMVSSVGEVTLVRYEVGLLGASGQELEDVHF